MAEVSRRQAQLARQLQRQAAEALTPVVLPTLVTVTRVTISPDARAATIFMAGWNELDASAQAAVKSAVVTRVTSQSQSKFTPHLKFSHDDAGEYAAHINSLLESS